MGEVCEIPEGLRCCLGQRMVLIRADETIVDPKYLLFVFQGPYLQHQVGWNEGTGTTVSNIRIPNIKAFRIPLPPLSEQQRIAGILGGIDAKIALNRQINTTLESMAQALFKSWFVDFDTVIDNALAAGNPIPEPLQARAQARAALGDQRQPLPESIRNQFPDRFVFTEALGWVPEGWEPRPLSELININPRTPLKKGQVAKYVDMKALPTGGYSVSELAEKEYSGGAKFINGDTLLARITPCLENGKTGVVDFLANEETGFGSTEFIVLRPKGAVGTPFIAALARNDIFRRHCVTNMVGSSGRQRVQNACFDSYFVATPNNEYLLEKFNDIGQNWFSRMKALSDESRALASLRDTLLPKLLSGELRVPEAERQVAEVL